MGSGVRFGALICALLADNTLAFELPQATPSSGRLPVLLRSLGISELNKLNEEVSRIRAEMQALPPLSLGNSGVRRGYHSTYTPIPNKPFWIVIDLRIPYSIDAVALVPAEGKQGSTFGPGYGFPRRFQIDVSNDPDFNEYHTIAKEVEKPFANPGPYPYFLHAGGVRARYVRLFATERWRQEDRIWTIAMGEVIVLSSGMNVAAGAAVYPMGGLSTRRPPVWMDENLVDSQTDLGLPVTNQPSQTHGYCSRTERSPDTLKWVQVDLSKPAELEEIRLVPAHPQDSPTPGYGFPLRFRVEAANDPGFRRPNLLANYTRKDYLNPGDNIISIRCKSVLARFVRVTATRLYDAQSDIKWSPNRYIFALAELQVLSKQKNIALGAPVQALDCLQGPRPPNITGMYPQGPTWAPRFLVDGYSSRYRLIGLEQWLEGLSQRGNLERRLSELTSQRAALHEKIRNLYMWGWATIAFLLGGGGIFAASFSHTKRQHELRDLRCRLARDLHDEIGSSLGSIRLTSQMAQTVRGTSNAVLGDLRNIELVAGEAADSMRDIMWLLDGGCVSSSELVNQMRLIAQRLLAKREFTLEVRRVAAPKVLSLEFRRNVLFAFKEALYNAARCSGASRIQIEIAGQENYFGFRIQDNGSGFDATSTYDGHGLENIRIRAQALRGSATISSVSAEGTTVNFRVPVT